MGRSLDPDRYQMKDLKRRLTSLEKKVGYQLETITALRRIVRSLSEPMEVAPLDREEKEE